MGDVQAIADKAERQKRFLGDTRECLGIASLLGLEAVPQHLIVNHCKLFFVHAVGFENFTKSQTECQIQLLITTTGM